MKYTQVDYSNREEVLKFPDHYVAVAVTVDDTNVAANAEGKKILPAGSPIGGVGGATLEDESLKVEKKNTQGAATGATGAGVDVEGVLLNDVDVTHGPAGGAMLIHGFVDPSKLPEALVADVISNLTDLISLVE
jgi:hypothetical protein